MCRNGIRIHGLYEGVEGDDMQGFVEGFIKEQLPSMEGRDLRIQSCHRQAGQVPGDKERPRSVVVYFLEYRIREEVLKAAWGKGDLRCKNKKVSFGPDYPAVIYSRIREYGGIPRYLKNLGHRCKTDHLGRITVTYGLGDEVVTYQDAEAIREDLALREFRGIPPSPRRAVFQGVSQRRQVMRRKRTTQEEGLHRIKDCLKNLVMIGTQKV